MRLLTREISGESASTFTFSLTEYEPGQIPRYAILSHRWTLDEVRFEDLQNGTARARAAGITKLEFCAEQAARDGLDYFWVDTCCIDKRSTTELSEAINSMFKWYQHATKCCVYLPDVSADGDWETAFRNSVWFTRGWTLQELLAPAVVEFFSIEGRKLGDKKSLERQIHQITGISFEALRGISLSQIETSERFSWTAKRQTTRGEDTAYCLLGIFDVQIPLLYGEGRLHAMMRLRRGIRYQIKNALWIVPICRNSSFTGHEAQLTYLEGQLFAKTYSPKLAITGPSGAGKTQLVLELLYRTRERHPECSIMWISAATTHSLQQGYHTIAEDLGILEYDDDKVDARGLIHECLTRGDAGQWLLVFDDADDIEMCTAALPAQGGRSRSRRLVDALPKSKQGRIIFITRSREVAARLVRSSVVYSSESGVSILEEKRDEAIQILGEDPEHYERYSGKSAFGEGVLNLPMTNAPTDSGYASLTRENLEAVSYIAEGATITGKQPVHEDAKTVYSDGVSVETSQRDSFVGRLAELLKQDVKDITASDIAAHEAFEDVKDYLAEFAMRLGQETSSPKLRIAMAFIHKYRALVANAFLNLIRQETHEEEEDERQKPADNIPFGELMDRWFNGETAEPPTTALEDVTILADESALDDLSFNDNMDELDVYTDLISTSESYSWLTSKIRNQVLLTNENNHACEAVRKKVLRIIPKEVVVKVGTASRVVRARFLSDWPLKTFLDAQLGSQSATTRLSHILSLTGSPPDIQAITCEDYVRQTWPTTGLYLIWMIEESLQNQALAADIRRPDGASLSAEFEESLCIVSISGSRYMVAELAEQLAWLSAALRVSLSTKNTTTCFPVIDIHNAASMGRDHVSPLDELNEPTKSNLTDNRGKGHRSRSHHLYARPNDADVGIYIFKLNFEFSEVDLQSQAGNCWQHVLPYCNIVSGFPIRKRAKGGLGIEIPLQIMAGLVGTKCVNQYHETPYIRGFSAIYSPTLLIDDTILWHLTCDNTGSHLSYRDVSKDIEHIRFEDLEAKRHIVGWCASMTDKIGTDNVAYSVMESQLPGTRPGCVLDNFLLTFPKEIVYGPTFALLQCQKSIHLASATYRGKLKYLNDHFVLLWDTEDDRGWPTNFQAAFLHLLRDTFVSYDAPVKGELVALWDRLRLIARSISESQSHEPTIQGSAWSSMNYETSTSTGKDNPSVANVAHQIFTRVCDQLFDTIDKLITFQEQVEYDDSRRTTRSLRLLEGWSFLDLTSAH